jgi:hypothetical protein
MDLGDGLVNRTEGNTFVVRDYNAVPIYQRKADRYMDATAMCRATGKRFYDYRRLDTTDAFLAALSSVTGIPATELVQSQQGGIPHEQGTWVHPKVALNLAQWCSAEFGVMVSCWIEELLTTGSVSIKPVSAMDVLRQQMAVLEEQERRISDVNATANLALSVASNVQRRADTAQDLAQAAMDTHTNNSGRYTLLGWCRLHKLPLNMKKAGQHGKALTKICKGLGIATPKQKDTRWGEVNSYPEQVLDQYFRENDFYNNPNNL